MSSEIFVGLDVSKKHLDVAVRPQGRHFVTPNTERGIKQLLQRLVALKPQVIVLEASGGYETLVLAALAEAHLPVSLVNPQKVRNFAGATGKLAKTDKLDAQVLAHFAEAVRPEPRPLPDQAQLALKATLTRRQQVVKMIVQEENRLEKTFLPAVRQDIQAHLTWLRQRLDDLDRDLKDQIRPSPCGRTGTACIKAFPASARWSPGPSWPTGRKRANCPARRPWPWSGWPLITGIAATSEAEG